MELFHANRENKMTRDNKSRSDSGVNKILTKQPFDLIQDVLVTVQNHIGTKRLHRRFGPSLIGSVPKIITTSPQTTEREHPVTWITLTDKLFSDHDPVYFLD
jgi:hypothetical protein